MTFKEIQLLEGKRPDLLGFDEEAWTALSADERTMADTWPNRRLEPVDVAIIQKARFGAEVKNSTWHYAKRRAAGRGPLSITVKKEEVAEIHDWSDRTRLPVVFFQVLFDELYCMSFRRMEAAIHCGHLYTAGDYEVDRQKSTTGVNLHHKFHLRDFTHRCAKVVFPSESTAEVRVLADGNVVPFIRFQPARATEVVSAVVDREIGPVEPTTHPAGPPTPAP